MKELLVIRITSDIPDHSVSEIYFHAKHYNINPTIIDVSSIDEFEKH